MKVFDIIKSKNIDELVDWIEKYFTFDTAPYWKWWDKNYCKNCKSVIGYSSAINGRCEFAWCELNSKCKFFEEMDNIPDTKQIIKMWLESESEDGIK